MGRLIAGRGGGLVALALLMLCGLASACDDHVYRDIDAEIYIINKRDDAFVPPAMQRLAEFRRLAIPQIETALHTAKPGAKTKLLQVLETVRTGRSIRR